MTARRRRQALALTVAIGVLGVGWLMSRPNGDRHEATPPTPQPTTTVGPQDLIEWRSVAGLKVPTSRLHGPHCGDGVRVWCFDDTDQGAAYAAANILVRTFAFAGPRVFGPTITAQVGGADSIALLRLTREAYAEQASTPSTGTDSWIAGYRLQTYPPPTSPDQRTVDVLLSGSDGEDGSGFTEFRVDLVRVDDDWHLVAPPWGDWSLAATPITTPDRSTYRNYDGTSDGAK